MTLTVGSLFAGIGGFDLGFERAGLRTVWLCEQDPFCRRVLAKHWPGVPCYPDVRTLRGIERVDVLCGGVPCQPVSFVGKGLGEADERWLWPDTLRVIGELRPRYAVMENPAALIGRGLRGVLGGLAEIGYDAEWAVVSAADFGAPHLRERLWIVAYPDSDSDGLSCLSELDGPSLEASPTPSRRRHSDGLRDEVADSSSIGRERPRPSRHWGTGSQDRGGGSAPDWWQAEPSVGRVVDGFSGRVDRLRALGNALVPQVAEFIGRRLMDYEASLSLDGEAA